MTERQRAAGGGQEPETDRESNPGPGPELEPDLETEPRWLGPALRTLRLRTGLSLNAVARQVGIDPAYLHRIEVPPPPPGRVTVPRRGLLLAIGRVLGLDPVSLDDLLARAGYVPQAVLALGGWDATLARVGHLLADPSLSPAARAEFREVVAILASRWSSAPTDPAA